MLGSKPVRENDLAVLFLPARLDGADGEGEIGLFCFGELVVFGLEKLASVWWAFDGLYVNTDVTTGGAEKQGVVIWCFTWGDGV